MHLRAMSPDWAAFDWLLKTVYFTLWPRIPPVALTCLKNAVAPQLSVSPICAYGPDRARSPQITIGAFADEPELAEPPQPASASTQAAATAAGPDIHLPMGLNFPTSQSLLCPVKDFCLTQSLAGDLPFGEWRPRRPPGQPLQPDEK